MSHHIFLSYSHKDTQIMRRVRNDLQNHGLLVWTDENLVPGTTSWLKSIERAIENTLFVIVFFSPDSKNSEWVEKEIEYASFQDRIIIPLLVRGNKATSIPLRMATSQWIDITTNYDGAGQLISYLCKQVGIEKTGEPIEDMAPSTSYSIEALSPQNLVSDQSNLSIASHTEYDVEQISLRLTYAAENGTAEALLLIRNGSIIATAGHLSDTEIQGVAMVINQDWNVTEGNRLRFIFANNKDYMLYTIGAQGDLILAMVFAGTTPLKMIRHQGKLFLEALEALG